MNTLSPSAPIYRFKDFDTGKHRFTRGRFAGWTSSTGLLKVRYAVFALKASEILVPEYLLTFETKQMLST